MDNDNINMDDSDDSSNDILLRDRNKLLSGELLENTCNDGCIEVELFFQDEDGTCRSTLEECYYNELNKYKCYQNINDYGHLNYAVMNYAASVGHLNCIKYLHKNTDVMWHTGLACVAAENNQLLCLKYIMEEMGDVSLDLNLYKHVNSPECKKYLDKFLSNKK